jgi:hypothetical protein
MPGAGTHTTISQRLAKIAKDNNDPAVRKFLTDPDLNADWSTYSSPDALQSRYTILGTKGPDIFYVMLDSEPEVQQLKTWSRASSFAEDREDIIGYGVPPNGHEHNFLLVRNNHR